MPVSAAVRIVDHMPAETLDWLLEPSNPAVAVLTRRTLMSEIDTPESASLWAKRNSYEPITRILAAQRDDGSWDEPARDYQKYRGSLWQIVFLGELWANGSDECVSRAAQYAFSRQKSDGMWSANPAASYFMPCLTANVGRGLARMGWAHDERVVASLGAIAAGYERMGFLGCSDMQPYTLNGYCHMLTPKVLLLIAEIPRELWPPGTEALRDACVAALRDKEVHRSLPAEFAQFKLEVWPQRSAERAAARQRFLDGHKPLHYGDKPGWLRLGYPLTYNSDALEALAALAAVDEPRRPEYEAALGVVEAAADRQMRWTMRTTFNGKMIADVEARGHPSKWLTLRALQVLQHFGRTDSVRAESADRQGSEDR